MLEFSELVSRTARDSPVKDDMPVDSNIIPDITNNINCKIK